MARKVFISFLGSNNYSPCHYCCEGYKSEEVRYVQEATLEYLMTQEVWTDKDIALILLTKGAEAANWIDDGHKNRTTGETIKQSGLHRRMKEMNLPIQILPLNELPDGNNEKEILEIFRRIFDNISDYDEIYFDLTHGFRYLPMLALVLGNYAKFLKRIKVKHLSYGNYEGRNKVTNEALLVNLSPLSHLQDWTFAAASFIQSGNVDNLASLSEDTYRPLLKESKGKDEYALALRKLTDSLKTCVEDFQTCRGLNIYNAVNIQTLKEALDTVKEDVIEPLAPVIQNIKSSIAPFHTNENIDNGFHAAEWCLNNGLYQQAATILQENVVSFFAVRHGIAIDDEKERHLINNAFAILFNALEEEKWQVAEDDKEKVKEILNDELITNKDVFNTFNNLSEVRNDINHSGMRSSRLPLSAKKVKANIEKCVILLKQLLVSNHVY